MLLGTANDKDTAEPGVMISPGARVSGPPDDAPPRLVLPKQISQWKKAVNDWLDAQAASRIAADGYDREKPISADNKPPGTVVGPDGLPLAAP